ncbi:MAG: hypothetical protein LBL01_07575 [Bifidobacteriaceae bacterium]|jgi:2-succinyl-5-enolpyruvyl-6-hydroxy-3-cyclohexene-1-carboxylate synthase|nr:hypothetical protein [Bifidobacteriaceae bacterium]
MNQPQAPNLPDAVPPDGLASAVDTARALVAGLVGAGVTLLVIAPGSRSAPLVYAAAERAAVGDLAVTVRTDERVAGFLALGWSAAGRGVGAVATTSGTAVANLHPAVMEAAESRRPLIAVTADRPAELHGVGANQTTDQRGVFGAAPVWERTLPAGLDGAEATAAARAAVEAARGRRSAVPGPAHINVQFREPLTPGTSPAGLATNAPQRRRDDGREDTSRGPEKRDRCSFPHRVEGPDLRIERAPCAAPGLGGVGAREDRRLFSLQLEPGPRTAVVAGFGAGPEAQLLAAAAGWPLLAEPASGAWYGPNAIPAARLAVELLGGQVERVVVYGRPVLSRPVTRLMANPAVETIVVHPAGGSWFDPPGHADRVVGEALPPPRPDPADRHNRHGRPDNAWLYSWLAAGRELERQLERLPYPSGPAVARAVASAAAGTASGASPGPLVAGSSSAIRDLDLAPPPAQPTDVAALRGVAGIDGTVAFASGLQLADGRPVRVLLGDLALAHDAGALLVPLAETAPHVQIVVLQDGGGGIFETLEPALVGPPDVFERFFATPLRVDLGALAAAAGAAFTSPATPAELAATLAAPPPGISLVAVPLDRSRRRGFEANVVWLSRNSLVPPSHLS